MRRAFSLLAVFILLIVPLSVFAQQKSNMSILPAGQTVNGNYFGGGGTVRVDGTVNGDAYVAGGTVDVNGTINGDLLVAGGTVNIRGNITNNIRAAGGTVMITGTVGRNLTVAGGTVTLEKNASVHGSVVAAAGTLTLLGPIDQDATLAGGTINIGSLIGKGVQAGTGQLNILPTAKINGNVVYTSSANAQIEKGAAISGSVKRQAPPGRQQVPPRRDIISGFLWSKIISFVALYIIGLLFLEFFPKFTLNVVKTAREDMWKSVGLGLLILIVTPLLALFLLITVVGIPFALFLVFTYVALLYIGKIFVAMYLGEWVAGYRKTKISPRWALFIGLLIHFLITIIPVVGWIAGVFMLLWGTGAYVLAELNFMRYLRAKNLL